MIHHPILQTNKAPQVGPVSVRLQPQTGHTSGAALRIMPDEEPKHILCIEDEADMIELFQIILRRKGFRFSAATGGKDGLRMVRELLPDLVLLDLMMLDMDGWEVYQQMKSDEKTRKIPVIVVTAKAQNIDKVLGLHIAKVDDYISKPFRPQELLDSVDRHFDVEYFIVIQTSRTGGLCDESRYLRQTVKSTRYHQMQWLLHASFLARRVV